MTIKINFLFYKNRVHEHSHTTLSMMCYISNELFMKPFDELNIKASDRRIPELIPPLKSTKFVKKGNVRVWP